MEASIRGHGISISDDLRDYVETRLSRLDRLVSRVIDAKVELRPGTKRSGRTTVTAQITIQTARIILRAEDEDPEVKVAIDRAADKLTAQLRRYHERRSNRKADRDEAATDPTTDAVLAELTLAAPNGELDDEEAGRVVRRKTFGLKPMDVDEAIDQMELLGHDFFLFDNTEDGEVSVVYRRRAGDYGLLVPDRT